MNIEERRKYIRDYMVRWRKENPERVRDGVRRWKEKNPEKVRDSHRRYYWKDPEKHRLQMRKSGRRRRLECREEALAHYGNKCACCGESRSEFLAIDHINGGGNQHRREAGIGSLAIWLKQNDYPPGFRVLCHNCNMARAFYGYCPHEREVIARVV